VPKCEGFPKGVELTDLYWDGEPKARSLYYAATVALPPTWRAARLGAQRKKPEGGKRFEPGLNERIGEATRTHQPIS
jgi:hypothetical protein